VGWGEEMKTINFIYKFSAFEIATARKYGEMGTLIQRVKERCLLDIIAKQPFEEKPMWFRITHKVRYFDLFNNEMSKRVFDQFVDEVGRGERLDQYLEEHLFVVEFDE
jgi:hypothetical protein